jgi:hypothetical protein
VCDVDDSYCYISYFGIDQIFGSRKADIRIASAHNSFGARLGIK